jgi:hypothetical protein
MRKEKFLFIFLAVFIFLVGAGLSGCNNGQEVETKNEPAIPASDILERAKSEGVLEQ